MADYVLDTFTGTGDLSTHVGETGATWSSATIFGGPYNPADVTLNGAGGCTTPGNVVLKPSGTIGDAEYAIEFDVTIVDTGILYPSLFFRVDVAGNNYYEVDCEFGSGHFTLNAAKVVAGVYTPVTGATPYDYYSSSVLAIGDHTLRIEIRDAKKEFFLDGVSILSFTDNQFTAAGELDIWFSTDGTTANSISRIQAASFDPIAPPGSTTYILDTFTGTGDLSTHSGELGAASWLSSGATTNLHHFTLDGAGRMVNDWGSSYLSPSGMPALADYYVEIEFYFSAGAGDLAVSARSPVRDYGGYEAYVFLDLTDGSMQINAAYPGTSGSGYVSLPTLEYNTLYIVRLEVVGSTATAYFRDSSGVDLVTPLVQAVSGFTAAGYASMLSTYHTGVSRFQAGSLSGPPPFWTRRVKCTEVDS